MKIYRYMGLQEFNQLLDGQMIAGRGTLERNKVCFMPETTEAWAHNEDDSKRNPTEIKISDIKNSLEGIVTSEIKVEFEVEDEKLKEMFSLGTITPEVATYTDYLGFGGYDGRMDLIEYQSPQYSLSDGFGISSVCIIDKHGISNEIPIDYKNPEDMRLLSAHCKSSEIITDEKSSVFITGQPFSHSDKNFEIVLSNGGNLSIAHKNNINENLKSYFQGFENTFSTKTCEFFETNKYYPEELKDSYKTIRNSGIPDIYLQDLRNEISKTNDWFAANFSKNIILNFYEKQMNAEPPQEVRELLDKIDKATSDIYSIHNLDEMSLLVTENAQCTQVFNKVWKVETAESTHFYTNNEMLDILPSLGEKVGILSDTSNSSDFQYKSYTIQEYLSECQIESISHVNMEETIKHIKDIDTYKDIIRSKVADEMGYPTDKIDFWSYKPELKYLPPQQLTSYDRDDGLKIGMASHLVVLVEEDSKVPIYFNLDERLESTSDEIRQEITRNLCDEERLEGETSKEFADRIIGQVLDKSEFDEISKLVEDSFEKQDEKSIESGFDFDMAI